MVISNMRLWSPEEWSGPDIWTWEHRLSNVLLIETIEMEEITQEESIKLGKKRRARNKTLETTNIYGSSKQTREFLLLFCNIFRIMEACLLPS